MTDADTSVWEIVPADFESPSAVSRCLALLSSEERTRHDAFMFERDRHLFRTAHAMTRVVLGRVLSRPPESLAFSSGPWGRPELAGLGEPPPLRFNLSHTPGLAALVVTRCIDCGIDVERHDRSVDPLRLSTMVMTPAERARLQALPPAAARSRFFEIWTLKEAYMKARGMGFSLPPQSFSIEPDRLAGKAGAPVDVCPEGVADPAAPAGPWWFWHWSPTPHHFGSVALRGRPARLSFNRFDHLTDLGFDVGHGR